MKYAIPGILILLFAIHGCDTNNAFPEDTRTGTSSRILEPVVITEGTNVLPTDNGVKHKKAQENKNIPPLHIISSTYFGGSSFERAQSVYIDQKGYIYIAGHTSSANFPVTRNAYNTQKMGSSGNMADTQDGYVAKLSPDGTKLIWSTLIGGSRRDQVYSVRTDSMDNVYIVGATGSEDFPSTQGVYDETFNGPVIRNGLTDIFVASLSSDGSRLRFSTFIGGAQGEQENPRGSIVLDEPRGRIYISGQTSAPDFPVTDHAYQRRYGGGSDDAFVIALSMDGKKLLASTFLGGNGSDMAVSGIAEHPSQQFYYIAGTTNSTNFPITKGAFQPKLASGNSKDPWWKSGDAFVATISPDLDTLLFATYYGGTGADSASHNQGLAVNLQGHAVIIGHTKSKDLPVTKGAYQTGLSSKSDSFIAIFTDKGQLARATYLHDTYAAGVRTGPHGEIYLSGSTRFGRFIETPGIPLSEKRKPITTSGRSDAFLALFDPTLSKINYATLLGGNDDDTGRSVWTDTRGRVIVGGVTKSPNFPVMAPYLQQKYGGDSDAFVVIFDGKAH